MAHFLLVHGAWHGAWCWHKLVPELEALGHRATAIDLPGHGVDRTPISNVTLDAYGDRIGHALAGIDEPAVLVGHSMGGVSITVAGERYTDQVAGLIYLTAIMLRNGESMMDNPVKASPSEFMAGFNRSADGLSITFDQSLIREAFYADCSEADIALARSCLVPQATAIMTAPIAASDAAWGSLPRSFIACTNDNALTLEGQRGMLERVGVDRVVELETSHSPFFSAPGELAARLVDLA